MNIHQIRDLLFPPEPSIEIEGIVKGWVGDHKLRVAVPPDKSAFAFKTWVIDFSHYQDDINLEAAYDEATAAGKHLVLIAKCSEGYAYYDPSFNKFYTEVMRLRNIGKYCIFIPYHFCRFDKSATLQIQTIEKALANKTVDGFMLDCETKDGASNATITGIIWSIASKFAGYGTKKINLIYSAQYWWASNVTSSTRWKEIALADAAHWGVPASRVLCMRDWPTWTVWQAGQVHGRLGEADDLDFGALSDSVNWFDDPEPSEYPFTMHILKPYDKLISGVLK